MPVRLWRLAALLAASLVAAVPPALAQPAPDDPGTATTEPPPAVIVRPVPPEEQGTPAATTEPPATTAPPAAATTTTPTPPSTSTPALPPPAAVAPAEPATLPAPAGAAGVADPGWTQVGFVPTARPLRAGDMFAQILGYMGGFGIQYGINGDADVSGGLTFFTLELAGKYSFYHNDFMAVSALAEIAFPFYKSFWPMSALDLEYMMFIGFGPLFSLWNDLAELDVGLLMIPALQWPAQQCFADPADPTAPSQCRKRPFDTDFAVMPYVYGSISLAGMARLMLGFEHFAVTARDDFSCSGTGNAPDTAGVCRDHDGSGRVVDLTRSNAADLNVPALLLGIRLHGERFMADIMLHFPMSHEWWDNDVGQYMIFIPTVSFGYLW